MIHIDEEDVMIALKSQKSKAVSLDGFSPCDLNDLAKNLVPILCSIFNDCVETCTVLKSWLTLLMFFIHKKGSKADPNNFRSIAIVNPLYKVFSAILNRRLQKYVDM